MTRVGILEVGRPSGPVLEHHGDYARMFRDYFADYMDLHFSVYPISRGAAVPKPGELDAWIVTGSENAVYEDHPWLPPLREFIRQTIGGGIPTLGICFGHQIIAQAMGGKVVKSDKGRGIGIHRYELTPEGRWLAPDAEGLNLIASHEDQVTEVPPGTMVLVTSAFCPYAGLAYGEAGLSLQPHPEYTIEAARETARLWHQRSPVDDARLAAAEHTYGEMVPDSLRLAPHLRNFLARKSKP